MNIFMSIFTHNNYRWILINLLFKKKLQSTEWLQDDMQETVWNGSIVGCCAMCMIIDAKTAQIWTFVNIKWITEKKAIGSKLPTANEVNVRYKWHQISKSRNSKMLDTIGWEKLLDVTLQNVLNNDKEKMLDFLLLDIMVLLCSCTDCGRNVMNITLWYLLSVISLYAFRPNNASATWHWFLHCYENMCLIRWKAAILSKITKTSLFCTSNNRSR